MASGLHNQASIPMTRTLRSKNGGSGSAHQYAFDYDLDDVDSLPPTPALASGTPWPMTAVPAEIADLDSGPEERPTPYEPYAFLDGRDSQDSIDADLTEPVPLLEQHLDPVRIIELQADEIGTRTLMGVGARAVRAVATAGSVEGRAARRGLSPTPGQPTPRPSVPLNMDSSGPPAVIISSQIWKDGSFPVAAAAAAPSVQPPSGAQEPLAYPVLPRAEIEPPAPMAASPAPAAPGIEPWWAEAASAPARRFPRGLALAVFAVALAGIGVLIGMGGL